jgi:glycosyltransferase involved in cell wall biosynthesis
VKILQMIDVPWDSGLAHYALVMSQGVQKNGHQVFVSAIPGQKPWHKAQRLGLETIPFVTMNKIRPLRAFIRKHNIDLINAHTGSTHSLAVAAALGQKTAVVRTRSDARAVKSRLGSGFLFKHTQRVIAAAEYIRQSYVKALRLPPKKVVTVYQGIELDDFVVKPLPSKPVLGIVARLDPVKGHRYLLEALTILKSTYPALRVCIIGREENIKKRDLLNIAERLRIDSMVEFLGFQTDVAAAMAACSIGVIASTGSEAVSRVALEWMAAGRPVVATRVGCLSEVIDNPETGFLIAPKDSPALAQALAKLLHDPAKLSAAGIAGRKAVEERFGLPKFVNETITVYEDALQEVKRHS